MVTIEADEEVWRELTLRKDPGDSFNDVLRRVLALDDSESAEASERADSARESGVTTRARDALADWQPTDVDTATARAATVATVGWLAAQESPQRKAAIEEWYADAELPLAFSTAWQKAIRPGLGALREQGLVDHRTNVGWRVLDGDE